MRSEALTTAAALLAGTQTSPSVVVGWGDAERRGDARGFLELSGFLAREAESGQDLERRIAEAAPDMVIIDVDLSPGCGLAFATSLRRRFPDMGILVLTHRGEVEENIDSLASGADACAPRDINPRILVAMARSLIRRIEANGPRWLYP